MVRKKKLITNTFFSAGCFFFMLKRQKSRLQPPLRVAAARPSLFQKDAKTTGQQGNIGFWSPRGIGCIAKQRLA